MDAEDLMKLDRDTLLAMVKEEIKRGSEDSIPYPPPLSKQRVKYIENLDNREEG